MSNIIKDRIVGLKKTDAEVCEKRWDMSRSNMERAMFREQSNEITFARQELERLLPEVEKEMHENMQYYMEYCEKNGYVTPMDWLAKHKHF